jgi:hypothetical protein
MLLYAGVTFLAVGVIIELLSGTMFRSFFNRKDYPPRYPKGVYGNVFRMNALFARAIILAGLAMAIVGLVIEIVSPT